MSVFKGKFAKSATMLVLAFGLVAVPVSAAVGGVTLNVNGSNVKYDVAPVLVKNTVLVPMKAINDTLGAAVTWDNNTQTVTAVKGDVTVIVVSGANTATVKTGSSVQTVALDAPAQVKDGRVLIPVRLFATAFGAEIGWNQKSQTVQLTFGDASTGSKTGATGATGAIGAAGAKGEKGDTGAQGAAGSQGAKGDTGAQGAKGDKGDKGDKGEAGTQGTAGTNGAGLNGAVDYNQSAASGYELNQVVIYNGSIYLTLKASPSGTPGSSADYKLLVAKGDKGGCAD